MAVSCLGKLLRDLGSFSWTFLVPMSLPTRSIVMASRNRSSYIHIHELAKTAVTCLYSKTGTVFAATPSYSYIRVSFVA
jgi:hypothetical protein